MKRKILITLVLSYFSLSVFADQLNCKSLSECIEQVSKSSGRQYTNGLQIKDSGFQEVKFEGSKSEIDKLLSLLLFNYGYARVPSVGNSWLIISARDIRYTPTPLIDSTKGEIPNDYDYVMVTHQLINKFKVNEVVRSFRPFMSRYGRIISMKDEGKIVIQDTGVNIIRLLSLLKLTDREATIEEIKEAKQKVKFKEKIKLLEAKHPKCSQVKSLKH